MVRNSVTMTASRQDAENDQRRGDFRKDKAFVAAKIGWNL
jgi:hypothetical protein